jgi:hypothetical protein
VVAVVKDFEALPSVNNLFCSEGYDSGNPLETGIRYRLTSDGREYRRKWALKKGRPHKDISGDGCTKKRPVFIGQRQRTWLWIYTCLRHQQIIGFHVIISSEGMRDAVAPLYRFLPNPPKNIWVDYACGMAEVALNWMPDYYRSVRFFHDVFHGYGHVCGPTHKSHRHREFLRVNTSLMEQVNAFIQPLRALLCSHTTKVCLCAFEVWFL